MSVCMIPLCGKPTEGSTGLCATHNKARRKSVPDSPKKSMKRVSDKLLARLGSYHEQARQFVRGKNCAVFPALKAEEVHHKAGRSNDLLLEKKYWLPVSRKGHVKIEINPTWAKEQGFTVSRLTK